jgi:signal transduction histidine kinase
MPDAPVKEELRALVRQMAGLESLEELSPLLQRATALLDQPENGGDDHGDGHGKALELQVQRMARIASIGQLAAGIAHEIRNPLTGIGITLESLHDEEGLSEEGRELVDDISAEVERLEALISGLLDYARPQPVVPRPMSVAKTMEWHRTYIEQCRKKGVSCSVDLGENPKVQGDPEKLKQLFLNLALNALEATEAGGVVSISASVSEGTPPTARVEVADTGCGMDAQTLEKVFDPFFTTKNEGTGLGLSIAHSIVEQHGGSITAASSTEGGGSLFTVDLPLYSSEKEH